MIVVFTALTALASTGTTSVLRFVEISTSICFGVLLGCFVGKLLIWFFKKYHIRDSIKVLLILSVSFLLLEVQEQLEAIVSVSGLLAIMSMGIIIKRNYNILAVRLSVKYKKLWIGAEVFLFVLVGIAVDVEYALAAAIGTIPMSMGLECGGIVLTVAVVSILLTAPFGAFCVDKSYKKLLGMSS